MKKLTTTTETFIDTQTLLALVNQSRKESGEPGVRNNNFIQKVLDELHGEFYQTKAKPSGGRSGRPCEVITMSYKRALRVAARESKAVRRTLVDKLEALQTPGGVLPAGQPAFALDKVEELLSAVGANQQCGAVTMTSSEIAELTGKRHGNVVRDVWVMLADLHKITKDESLMRHRSLILAPGVSISFDARGYVGCFTLDRNHVECLLMGYSATLRMKVLARLRELEENAATPPAVPAPMAPSLPAETISAGIALLDGSKKLLHLSDSSILAGLRRLQTATGLPDLLPGYAIDAPPDATGGSSEPTAALRQLLSQHGIKLSPQKAYAILAGAGIVEQKTRTSTRGEKHFWCVTEKGMLYGKNLTSPGNPRQTQPHFYEAKFSTLSALLTR